MNNCKYCNAPVEDTYCDRKCYELKKRLPTVTYFADHLAYLHERTVDFQEKSLKYTGCFDSALLHLVSKYDLPIRLRNKELPVMVAVKMGCVFSDIDEEMEGPVGVFDYRMLFRAQEGFDMQIFNEKAMSPGSPKCNLWAVISHLEFSKKEFMRTMKDALNQMNENARIGAKNTDLQRAFFRLKKNLEELWKEVHSEELHWKDSVFKPASVATWEVMLDKCISSRHYTGAKVAATVAKIAYLMTGEKIDYRFIMDELRPSDYITIKPKLRVDLQRNYR